MGDFRKLRAPCDHVPVLLLRILGHFNPCGENDQLIVHFIFAKKWVSEAKLRVKISEIVIFALLRSAIF